MNIQLASKYTGISADMIRFYEKKGIIKPKRNLQNNYRDYTEHDLYLIVMARQYNCLGISLDDIASQIEKRDVLSMKKKLDDSVTELEEEYRMLKQRILFSKDLQENFDILNKVRKPFARKTISFYYYPRSSFEEYAELFSYQSGRPVFRIRYKDLNKPEYPVDQGMMFTEKVNSSLPLFEYSPCLIYKTCLELPTAETLSGKHIKPLLEEMKNNGYQPVGDAFIFQIMGGHHDEMTDIISTGFICEPL